MDKQTLLAGYGLGQYLIAGNTGGVTHEESLVQPSRAGNCINWIAGHLLDARGIILGLLGGSPFLAAEETALYKRGSGGIKPGGKVVQFGRLQEGLEKTAAQIAEKLQAADQAWLDERLEIPNFPITLETKARWAYLSMMMVHETYHAGQIGISRRLLGKESFVK